MAFPALPTFGIVDNPLIESPFVGENTTGSAFPPGFTSRFLLLSGGDMKLLSGGDFLLLE